MTMITKAQLRRSTIDTDSTGKIALTQSGSHYIMIALLLDGTNSQHSLLKSATPLERLEAHWSGFLNNHFANR